MKEYNHIEIEKKWQDIWGKDGLNKAEDKSSKPKYYCLIEFPYPSGDGLHVGHIRSNTAMDIIARKRRAEGYNVLYPIGWDAFGLPTENYAVKTKTPPQEVTKKNTDVFRRQLKSLGFSFDWSREINTTDPEYYKWTQWIFLQMFKKGLAYKGKMPINWCLSCKIGLANEEVVDGACERCGGPTEKREKEQWMLAITKYADRLYSDLDKVDYLEKIKIQQRNWIGRSNGAEISFKVKSGKSKVDAEIKVFTTRPDTLFGATYMVLAPEHSFVTNNLQLTTNKEEILEYTKKTTKKTEIERTSEGKEKTGVKLEGIKAINPANKEEVPIFIADYVLKEYGTGAIMAVPAHDERDYEFAKRFNLPIRDVIEPIFTQSTEPGKVVPGLPFTERDAVIVIVKHWSEEKFLALKWKKVDWGTFITGGIEKGQTPEEAAKMEIKEESGYLHPKLIKDFGVLHGTFYHVPKKVNQFAHSRTLYFELVDDDKEVVSEEEKEKHETLWLTKKELGKFLTPDSHLRALEILNGKDVYTGIGMLVNSGLFNGLDSEEAKAKITEFVGGQMKTTYKLRDWVFSRQRYWGEPIPLVFCEKDGWVPVAESDLPVELPEIGVYTPTDTGESPLSKIDEWVNVKCPKCGEEAKRETDTMPNWAGSSWYYIRYVDHHNDKELADKNKLKHWMPVDWYNGGMEHTTLHLLYSRFWHKFLYDIGVVPTDEPYQKRTSHGMILAESGEKMSKSKNNVINPDDIVLTYGADTLRLYEMFMGPFDQSTAWSTKSIIGPRKFLERVWRLKDKIGNVKISEKTEIILNQTIKKVGEDIESLKFNTSVSQMMILLSALEDESAITKESFESLLKILSVFAPHVTEELWSFLGHSTSVHDEPWPKHDESKLKGETATIVIQINGKVRGSFSVSVATDNEEVKKMALESEVALKWLGEGVPQKVIYVPGKLVSIVI